MNGYNRYTVRRRKRKWPFVILLLLLVGYVFWALSKPLPLLQPIKANRQIQSIPIGSHLTWPSGQSAVGILGSDALETHGQQKPLPTASTAKILTSLVVLDAKPLNAGQSGPAITLTKADVDIYNKYFAQDSSLVPVKAGEKITEYQMLQAILLPSANNMADSLAIWAFGSLKNYAAAANVYLVKHRLTATVVGSDASGLSPTTKASAHDLVKLGELAMQQPVLTQIVNQKTATGIPVAHTIHNVNFLLGESNIIGIKTGNSDHAGGVYVSASRIKIDGQPTTIITALTGSKTLFQALKESLALIKSAQANFGPVTIVKAGQAVSAYQVPWGGTINAVATKDLKTTAWNGSSAKAITRLKPVAVGTISAGTVNLSGSGKSVPVELDYQPLDPTIWWRLAHPF